MNCGKFFLNGLDFLAGPKAFALFA